MIRVPFGCVPREVAADPRVPDGALRVLIVIASYAGHESGLAWPSLRQLARDTDRTVGTAKHHVDALVAAGWLILERPGGGRRNATYRLPWIEAQRATPSRASDSEAQRATPSRANGNGADLARDPVARSARSNLAMSRENAPQQTNKQTDVGITSRDSLTRDADEPRRKIEAIRAQVAAEIATGRAGRYATQPRDTPAVP